MAKISGEKLKERLTSVVIRNEHLDYDNYFGKGWNNAMHCAITMLDQMISKAEKKKENKVKRSADMPENNTVQTIFGINDEEKTAWTFYEGRPFIFEVAEANKNERVLVSRSIIGFEPFDIDGCTNYDRSSLKCFLNEEFANRFTKEFRSMLSSDGFYLLSEDEISIYYLSPHFRIKKYKGRPYPYWIRSNKTATYYVDTKGNKERSPFAYSESGVVPACKIILPDKMSMKEIKE